MSTSERSETGETTLAQDLLYMIRYYLFGRKGLIVLAVLAVGAALVLNWSWLVAIGLAPLILGVLPCLAMCAFGLCMNKMMGKSCSSETGTGTAQSQLPTRPNASSVPELEQAGLNGTESVSLAKQGAAGGATDVENPTVSKENNRV